jgi:hypothetical protein
MKRKLKRQMKRNSSVSVAWDHIGLMHPEIFDIEPVVDMTKEEITRYFGCPTCGSYAGEPCTTTPTDYKKLIGTKAPWVKLAEQYGTAIGGLRPSLHNERQLLAAV